MSCQKTSRKPNHYPILLAFLLVYVFTLVVIFDEIVELNKSETKLKTKLDSLKTEHVSLKKERDSLKERSEKTDPRVIWLARAIYSETDKKKEMKYVGWVIRNRVELNFRGDSTYASVILASKEFSAFNRNSSLRFYYATKPYSHIENIIRDSGTWKNALEVARDVVYAGKYERPFTKYTLFFYSEVSMPSDDPHPDWRKKYYYVPIEKVKPERFRFFADPYYEYTPKNKNIFTTENEKEYNDKSKVSK